MPNIIKLNNPTFRDLELQAKKENLSPEALIYVMLKHEPKRYEEEQKRKPPVQYYKATYRERNYG